MINTQKILIVDDDKVMIKLLKMQLSQKGFDTMTAYDGVDAWDIISNPATMPDIVILDVLMPRMDGLELLSKIKETKLTQHIAVLMLTTENKVASLSRTLNTGIIDYIIKPATSDQIMSRLLTVHRKLRNGVHQLKKKSLISKSEEDALLDADRQRRDAAAANAAIEKTSVIDEREARSNISVLFIECYEANKHSLGKALSDLGYRVNTVVVQGQEKAEKAALETLAEDTYHIIIIDSAAEHLDGYQLTRKIRDYQNRNKKSYGIIGVGEESKVDDSKQWLIAGMNEYFQKPVPVKTVVNAIKLFVEKYTF